MFYSICWMKNHIVSILYTRVQSFFTGKWRKSFNYKRKRGFLEGETGRKTAPYTEKAKIEQDGGI